SREDTLKKSSIYTVTEPETVVNHTLEYVDWNDYELMAKDAKRRGLGEQGTEFNKTLSADEKILSEKLYKQYKFNAFASDHISLERSIGDTRTEVCKTKKYLKNIPPASVSIILSFHNEKNSTILRSIHSIINRSPKHLLKEIVLVDDLSTDEELKEPLEMYIQQHFSIVRIVRNTRRQGLIRTRIIGANATTGDILVFLDAHVEVNYNYLPPLIEPIVLDYRKIVCPFVDTIENLNMKIRPSLHRERGAFSWNMVYRRLPVFQKDESVPHPVPAMLGAAFAISRRWWEEIGRYDPGLEVWGGEQYEISFKSWMCGGSVVDSPCARVAHLFRPLPYVMEVTKDHLAAKNLLRVAKVWMDEYIEYVFQRRPIMRKLDPGNLTEQIAIRKRLNCKSFKWYLTEVAPDLLKIYPPIEPPNKAWGLLRSIYNKSACVFKDPSGSLLLGSCLQSDNNYYIYDWRQHIQLSNKCFTRANLVGIFMTGCFDYEQVPNQQFVWDQKTGRIVNFVTKYCMDVNRQTQQVVMAPCNVSTKTQSWMFDYFNSTLVREVWEKQITELNM
ncbi:unnamed protein product, partial [Candidula unifasciata]